MYTVYWVTDNNQNFVIQAVFFLYREVEENFLQGNSWLRLAMLVEIILFKPSGLK